MSPSTKRPLILNLPWTLQLDLIPHGRTVRVCDSTGAVVATMDRPLAEWIVDLVNVARKAA